MQRNAKRVVITGASSGIGAATAELFAARGAQLVLAARDQTGLDDIAARCERAGGTAIAVPTDVTDPQAVARLAADARDLLGGMDLWFADVGIGAVGKYHEVPIDAHARVIAANLLSHMYEAHAALPIFLEQKYGIFVNMISIGGFVATPFAAAYSASKFGLRGLSQALRGEVSLHPHIHICDVYPIFVDTPAIGHAANYTGAELMLPPGALDPRQVARAVVRLADHPRNSTGVGIPVALLKLAQLLTPNLGAAVVNGWLGSYTANAKPAPVTDGTIFEPPTTPSGIDGGQRRPPAQRAAIAAAGAGLAALAVGAVWLARRRRRE